MRNQAVHKRTRLPVMRPLRLIAGVVACAALLAGCSGGSSMFPTSIWGNASPRVTNSAYVPKGGGRAMVGKPYQVAGRWYTPRVDPNYDRTGKASWYGSAFHGRLTANGEIFDQNAITAAHPTLPLPSYVRVTNLQNHRSLLVRVNDRGPFVADRIIDLSRRSADMLGFGKKGVVDVRVKYVGPAPLEGDDTRVLLASLDGPGATAYPSPSPVTTVAYSTPTEAPATSGSRRSEPAMKTLTTLFTNPLDLFAYANATGPDNPVNAAFAATENMAVNADLLAWQQETDVDARKIDVDLGSYANPVKAESIARAFALIAAVDEKPVEIVGKKATSLGLSMLKPGATRADVLGIAKGLGLEDVAFRD
nr:septal ring lytic transglycosylase RlpA family protein [uncultured Sphaerochaeta sp.]